MEKSDVKQCHRFLQDTELVPRTEFMRMKSLDTTCFKTGFSEFTRPKVHLLNRCQCLFLKNM